MTLITWAALAFVVLAMLAVLWACLVVAAAKSLVEQDEDDADQFKNITKPAKL